MNGMWHAGIAFAAIGWFAGVASASQGTAVMPGTAGAMVQLAMPIMVFGGSALMVGIALVGAVRRASAQPRRQLQFIRGTMTVPLGRNSCTRLAVHSRTALGPGL